MFASEAEAMVTSPAGEDTSTLDGMCLRADWKARSRSLLYQMPPYQVPLPLR
jgi:hypothetical protein